MDTAIDTSFEDPDRFQPFRASPASARARQGVFAGETPSFGDLLDVVNPLQHLPVIGNFYREWTGDRIGHAARLAGGTLFAGPLGLAMASANVASLEGTGRDIGGHVVALVSPGAAPATPDAPALAKTATQPAAATKSAAVPGGSVVAAIQAQSMRVLSAAPGAEPASVKPDAAVPTISQQADAALAALAAQTVSAPAAPAANGAAAAAPSEPAVAQNMMAALDAYGAMMRARAASAMLANPEKAE